MMRDEQIEDDDDDDRVSASSSSTYFSAGTATIQHTVQYVNVRTCIRKKFYETNAVSECIVDEWHHYAVTFDDLNVRRYVDGVEIASKATGQEETVGKDFRLYDTAMTQQEIEEWFNDDC
eukprot:scaffold988_cov49-Attheya_sp.AAC.3